jgi:hypothetical protein
MLGAVLHRFGRGQPDRRLNTVPRQPQTMSPEMLQGIQNYMRLFLRGQNTRGQHDNHRSQNVLREAYGWNTELPQLWQNLHGNTPHPADLAQYLDLMNMAGVEEGHPNMFVDQLISSLVDLHRAISDPSTGPLLGQQYGNNILQAQPVRNRIMEQAYEEQPGAYNTPGGILTDLQGERWPRELAALRVPALRLQEQMDQGEALAFPDAYEYGRDLADNHQLPSRITSSGHALAERSRRAILRGIMPLLEGPAFSHLRGA